MMITETMLIIVACSVAAAIVIGIATYVGVSRRQQLRFKRQVESTLESQPVVSAPGQELKVPSSLVTQSEASQASAAPIVSNAASASAPIQEAPAPFSEDTFSTPGTSAPTDVTALANIVSPINATPTVLVIPTPKRRTRTKRLPTDGSMVTPRRRRSSKSKPMVPEAPAVTEALPVPAETQAPNPQNASS